MVAVLVLGGDAILRFTNLEDRLKPLIVDAMAEAGVSLSIEGPISAQLLPLPRAQATRITLRNSSRQLIAEAETARFSLDTSALLRFRRGVDMQLTGPKIAVTIDTQGRSNLDLTVASGKQTMAGGRVTVKDGTLVLDDQRLGFKVAVEAANFTAAFGEDRRWGNIKGTARSGGLDLALSLQLGELNNGTHPASFSLRTDEGHLTFTGTLSDLSPDGRAIGKLNTKLYRPAKYLDMLADGGQGAQLLELPPTLRCGSLGIDADIDMSRNSFKVPRFEFASSTTELKGEASVELAPAVRIDARLHAGDVALTEFMRRKADWIGLIELFFGVSTSMLDALPDRGVANLRLDIDRAEFAGQPMQAVAIDIGIDDHVGTLRKFTARLPGGTDLALAATLAGTPTNRQANGRLTLKGERLAETMRWLFPSDEPPTQDGSAPFEVTLDLSPRADGRHEADITAILNGLRGEAKTAIRFGRKLEIDAEVDVAAIDPLPFLPFGGPNVPTSLRLTGLKLLKDVTIDTHDLKAPITVRRSALEVAGVDAAFAPQATPAAPVPKLPTTNLLPTQIAGAYLGDLPRRVLEFMRPGPERSAAAKIMPSVEASLGTMDQLLPGLDFLVPATVKIGRLKLKDAPGMPDEIVITNFDLAVAASKSRAQPNRVMLSTLKPRLTIGESRFDDLRIEKLALDAEGTLTRDGGVTRLTSLKLNDLTLDGDIDDPVEQDGGPRRLPVSLKASGESDGTSLSGKIAHFSAGELALFNDIDIRIEARRDGVLSFVATTGGPTVPQIARTPLRCTVTPRGPASSPILDFRIALVGTEAPQPVVTDRRAPPPPRRVQLLRAVQSEGFATSRAVVIRELQLRLGETSSAAARLAVTAPDPAARDGSLALVDGCVDASLQSRPRLASIGHLPQQILFPVLGPLWQGDADSIRTTLEGGFHIAAEALTGLAPFKVGIERRGRPAGGRLGAVEAMSLELDAVRVQLQPQSRRAPLRISFGGIRLRDGAEELRFSAPPGGTLAAFEQAPDNRRSCEGGANMHAEINLGIVNTINVPLVQRFVNRISQVARGERGGAAPVCDPLTLNVKAVEIGTFPDLMRVLNETRAMQAAAARAPLLREVDLKLRVSKDLTFSFELSAGLAAARQDIFAACSARNPRTGKPRDFDAKGTAHFRNGRWDSQIEGNFTCLDLVEAQTLAQMATGKNLKGVGASVREGHVDLLSFDLALPPTASLGDLARASGSFDFFGDLALDVDSSLHRTGTGIPGLDDVFKRGVDFSGRIELDKGELSGSIASKDPAAGNPRHADYRYIAKWPDLATIAFRGNLMGRTINTDVTVRSTDWRFVRRDPVCFDSARRDRSDHFPSWVQRVSICTPLGGAGSCGNVTTRQPEQREYACR